MMPSYKPPSIEKMRNTILPRLAEKLNGIVHKELDQAISIASISDLWGSPTMDSHVGISASYITQNYKARTVLLDCPKMSGSYNAENIHGEYETVAERYRIKKRLKIFIVSWIQLSKCIFLCFKTCDEETDEDYDPDLNDCPGFRDYINQDPCVFLEP